MLDRTRVLRPPPRVAVGATYEAGGAISSSSSQRTFVDMDEEFDAELGRQRVSIRDYEIEGLSKPRANPLDLSPARRRGEGLPGVAYLDRTNQRSAMQAAYALQLKEQIEEQK